MSSIIFYPFLLFKKSLSTRLFSIFLLISFAMPVILYLYSASGINIFNINNINLIRSYLIKNESVSIGVFYRIIPSLIAFLVFIIYLKNFKILNNYGILQFFSILFVITFCLIFFGFTTLADRINFYLIPYQVLIFNEFYSMYERNSKLKLLSISFMYFAILIIWLTLSDYSQSNWQNYSTIF